MSQSLAAERMKVGIPVGTHFLRPKKHYSSLALLDRSYFPG
jgi:hypothetical protein